MEVIEAEEVGVRYAHALARFVDRKLRRFIKRRLKRRYASDEDYQIVAGSVLGLGVGILKSIPGVTLEVVMEQLKITWAALDQQEAADSDDTLS